MGEEGLDAEGGSDSLTGGDQNAAVEGAEAGQCGRARSGLQVSGQRAGGVSVHSQRVGEEGDVRGGASEHQALMEGEG